MFLIFIKCICMRLRSFVTSKPYKLIVKTILLVRNSLVILIDNAGFVSENNLSLWPMHTTTNACKLKSQTFSKI